MIPQNFEYTAARTLDEAIAAVAAGAKPLAGGMSLIPMMKLRLATPDRVVDIGRIKELNYIVERSDMIHIGAATTHYDVENSPLVRGKCPLLAETAANIGDGQVRNMGTIGGSVAHADPAADYPAALQALDAKFVLRSSKGERTIGVSEFFVDTFATVLEPGEMIREIVVPVESQGTGTSYQKMAQPASGFAIVGVAVRMARSGGKITLLRIGVTGLAGKSYRAVQAEFALGGDPANIQKAAALVPQGIDANSDLHASAEYRTHLAVVYATRALAAALARSA
jgi:carbon-monoxide dehydrogenase medium subunit